MFEFAGQRKHWTERHTTTNQKVGCSNHSGRTTLDNLIESFMTAKRFDWIRIVILVVLSVCAYLPALRLPFISDDFVQIPQARQYSAAGWQPLWHDTTLRSRATYMVLSATLDSWFGFNPVPFYVASILLHAMCVLLVYALCAWPAIPSSVAFWTACFFAIYEGHQEAVMWVAAAGELLVFLFGMAAWICWVKWLRRPDAKWYAAALVAFLLGIASKESIWVFPFLMAVPLVWTRAPWRWGLLGIAPFFAIAGGYVAWIWWTRMAGGDNGDIRFSLQSPWLLVLLNSSWRLVSVWGVVAVGLLLWLRNREDRSRPSIKIMWIGVIWVVLGLLPNCFLTYMRQVPSRHTYLASVGLALWMGTAAYRLTVENCRKMLATLVAVALVCNVEIIWVKKMSQFRERAEPSELLLKIAAEASGLVFVDCTPFGDITAAAVLRDAGAEPVLRDRDQQRQQRDPGCFVVEYTNRAGEDIRVDRQLGTLKHGAFY